MKTVTIRNTTFGSGMPKICVPLAAADLKMLESQLKALSTYDLIEFRADAYTGCDEEALKLIRSVAGEKPVLFTIRTKNEGGSLEISDEDYMKRNVAAAANADLVDLEFSRLYPGWIMQGQGYSEDEAQEYREDHSCAPGNDGHRTGNAVKAGEMTEQIHRAGALVIGSFHDFFRTPDASELILRLSMLQKCGCDLTKAAVMPREKGDVLELMFASLEMEQTYADRPYVTMSMGEDGKITRIAGSFTGSAVTFAAAGCVSAPGQMRAELIRPVLEELAGKG